MASLKKLVETYQEDLLDGINWVVFWKTGCSWHADIIFTEIDDDNPDPEYDPISVDTKEYLEMIYKQDNRAIILNGYYCSSFYEEESLADWVKHVRYCYEIQEQNAYQVKRFLELREVVLTEKDKKDIAKAIELKEKVEAESSEETEATEETKETTKRDITQTIEGQKFLDSEVGAELIEKVLKWDRALTQGYSREAEDYATYLKGAQAMLKYFTGLEYYFTRAEKLCGIINENGNWLFRIR